MADADHLLGSGQLQSALDIDASATTADSSCPPITETIVEIDNVGQAVSTAESSLLEIPAASIEGEHKEPIIQGAYEALSASTAKSTPPVSTLSNLIIPILLEPPRRSTSLPPSPHVGDAPSSPPLPPLPTDAGKVVVSPIASRLRSSDPLTSTITARPITPARKRKRITDQAVGVTSPANGKENASKKQKTGGSDDADTADGSVVIHADEEENETRDEPDGSDF